MLAEVIHLLVPGAVMVAVMMLILWAIHLAIKNAAIVDFGWAIGLALLALWYAWAGPGYHARKWAMASMAGFWGLRLGIYLLFARVIGHKEEGRYVQLRREWKTNLPLRFLLFFELQALLDVVLSLPFLLACLDTRAPLGFLEKLGAGIWLVAILGESSPIASLIRSRRIPSIVARLVRPASGNTRV